MKFLLNSLLFSIALLGSSHSFGQTLGRFDVISGLEKYPLNSLFNADDTSLKFFNGSRLEYKGRIEETYIYSNLTEASYIIAGVKSIMFS